MIITRRKLLLATALAVSACTPPESTDESAIEALMRATWDRPDTRLDVGPIAIAGDYAVADWTQGEAGGRALLRRRDDGWRVTLCAGDVLRTEEGLIDMGVAADAARALSTQLRALERNISAQRLARMRAFGEVVRMDEARPH